MRWPLLAAFGVGALVLLLAGTASAAVITQPGRRRGYSYGGAPRRSGVDRDPANLLPGFADKLEILFQRMRARGFKPYLWEGRRSAARAGKLAAGGTGIKLSMHILGAAADILDENKLWSASPAFWSALGEESRRLGLTWGGNWRRADKPHVQAVAVSQQTAFRSMSPAERSQFVA
jgi:hypothetical protein